jgi:ABC-type multidrug transport system fused ATPase/permease subunit
MNGKQKFKKYIEPLFLVPRGYIETAFESVWEVMYYIVTIELLRHLFKALELWQKEQFYSLLPRYIYIIIIYLVVQFSRYKLWWQNAVFQWSQKLYEIYLTKFIQADGNIVEKIGTGRFIMIIQKWVHDWLDGLWILIKMWVYNLILFLYAFFFIASISIWWALGSLVSLILSAYIATKANIWMAKTRRIRQKEENEASHQAVVALMSKNELLQSGGIKNIITKIKNHFEKARSYHRIVLIAFLIIEEIPRFLFLFVRLGIYIYLGNLIFAWIWSYSDFGIFIMIMTLMEKTITQFLQSTRSILRDFSSVELLWETFEKLPPIKWYDEWKSFVNHEKDIKIKNITYWYNKTLVFEDFSLTIPYGQKTAFVWASGGGKTTLLKLIAGYIYPQEWAVEILWNNLSETALKTYFPHIGYLTQEPWVFDASIRENLESVLQKIETEWEDIREEKIIKALKLAKCDFVFELEKGIETEIGERGVRLSGWQKQRLAIAKIFLKDPSIILLDEPTSALDSFSEEAISEALEVLFKWRTVIIVAHRLQTVKKADDIIVFENGKVLERGKHQELVQKKWLYAKMLKLQSGF